LINVDGDNRHDLDEPGLDNRGDAIVVGADEEDNAEVDDCDINENKEEVPGPSKKGKQLQNWAERLTLAI